MASSGGGSVVPGMGLAETLLKKTSGLEITLKRYVVAFLILNFCFLLLDWRQTFQNWLFVGFFAPLWAPVLFGRFAFLRFVQANKAEAIAKQKTVLLELRMPRDTQKTPLAMEAILSSLHMGSGEGTWYKKWVQGGTRPWFSLEIASIGGRVRFFVWTRENLRRGIESMFYAQYPGMEIIEAEDYSRLINPAGHDYEMFGDDITHTKPDAFPIKTYVDYKLDQPGAKPEEQIDPLTQLIEFLGSIGPEEQIWFQMVIRMTKGEKYAGKKTADGKDFTWREEAMELIEKIRKDTSRKTQYVDPVTGKMTETEGFPSPTKGQSDTMAAIERNISKQGFDVGMRVLYTAPKKSYEGGKVISFLISGMFKPFANESFNGFKPVGEFDTRFNDYPWEDRGGHLKHHLHLELVDVYRRRAFFHEPYVGHWMTMSTEEIATLFHVPSSSTATPGLPRIQSTTGGAPSNLPT